MDNEEKICTYCEKNIAEFYCDKCGEPTCEDCLVPYDQFNLIEGCICQSCYELDQLCRANEYQREEKENEEREKKKEKRNAKARARYNSPEQKEKRKKKKEKREQAEIEYRKKLLLKLSKIVNDMFR